MSINTAIQGKSYPRTSPYLVGREKIREFARAVYAHGPAHFEVEAAHALGHSDLIAPTTFPVVIQELTLRQLLEDPEAGIDFSRVVHGNQQFTYTRAVVAGDELRATLTVTSVKTLGAHSMVTSETNIVDDAGDHVVTAISTLVVRGDE
ncbi:MaoC family dehydratase N-terminal domain-containing protein [Lysinibacter sp. HNR]|uniref:FAS1-like dehydratase domain-containing protein n=1 Tax=Lysinibacter sp. HNR TaxID=3031408 RepID=UPI002435D9E1|nr:MaoC family dehydratase N-terminal domain-containing protein [Lysinibacter sp. HNR]WGD37133.1 MaoC family dehydratase N-terminal domain-containing protein [Lysinibacter sp. HNR]